MLCNKNSQLLQTTLLSNTITSYNVQSAFSFSELSQHLGLDHIIQRVAYNQK